MLDISDANSHTLSWGKERKVQSGSVIHPARWQAELGPGHSSSGGKALRNMGHARLF